MNKFLKISAPVVAVALAGLSVNAAPISGLINLSGSVQLDKPIGEATEAVTVTGVSIGSGNTGSFQTTAASGAITFNGFAFQGASPETLWSFTGTDSQVYSFSLLTDTIMTQNSSFLQVKGTGTMAIGSSTANGTFTFSLSDASGTDTTLNLTFQNSNFVPTPGVPDGGTTLSLLGGALMGLGLIKRKFMA